MLNLEHSLTDRTTTYITVQPDADGGWSVTRDRIVDGHFAHFDRAEVYARHCADRARAGGLDVQLHIEQPTEIPQG